MNNGWIRVRKKPVVVTAISVEKRNLDLIRAIPSLVALNADAGGISGKIKTLEGSLGFSESDLIIKGVEGECYPIKRNIFKKTYEVA